MKLAVTCSLEDLLTLKPDRFVIIFALSLDKSLCASDIQLWQCLLTSIIAGKSESGALN